ncbi:hypothetical protein M3M35_05180 [Fructilactobacillus myrtifloralis]|uniref:Uncharacterized protein n=1 Tax=Fructilactobacillus myrtifloralis TaxID=2940301 RepID=A0ABY5BM05_9LACO|nr:hypothetical protein [Fructilactobacillus myrtifloralis]USS84702.1 hypothetical protein M3M35_05180 [Fructilactobacillus myrtifloralis]
MRNHEPTYRSVSVGMVTVGIPADGGQIIAKVIGNNVIAIDEQLNRATVTGPDRAGRYAIGDFVYFKTDKRNRHTAVAATTVAHHLDD